MSSHKYVIIFHHIIALARYLPFLCAHTYVHICTYFITVTKASNKLWLIKRWHWRWYIYIKQQVALGFKTIVKGVNFKITIDLVRIDTERQHVPPFPPKILGKTCTVTKGWFSSGNRTSSSSNTVPLRCNLRLGTYKHWRTKTRKKDLLLCNPQTGLSVGLKYLHFYKSFQ